MLLGARQFFERRGAPTPPLPYDAEVEYLESTGTQYIDIGIVGENGVEIECRFQLTDLSQSTAAVVYGSYVTVATLVALGGVNKSGKFTWSATTLSMNSNVDADTNWHTTILSTELNNKHVSFDGVTTATSTNATEATGTRSIFLFARNPTSDTGVIHYRKCRISKFSARRVGSDGNYINLIPVRVGQIGYMYDSVSGQLLGNSGTGAFTIGQDKS